MPFHSLRPNEGRLRLLRGREKGSHHAPVWIEITDVCGATDPLRTSPIVGGLSQPDIGRL
jgi:hypothetical protein